MLADAICWGFAIALIFTQPDRYFTDIPDTTTRLLLALGFIFVGTISRGISIYRDVHSKKNDTSKNT